MCGRDSPGRPRIPSPILRLARLRALKLKGQVQYAGLLITITASAPSRYKFGIKDAAFCPDGRLAIFRNVSTPVRIHDTITGAVVSEYHGFPKDE